MFINDLSPMANSSSVFFKANSVAVGWLDRSEPFPKGTTTEIFKDKLHHVCRNPVRLMRGFHICPFCRRDDARGTGGIHVIGYDGVIYVAPLLIWHYVTEHDYVPPNQFIQAIMNAEVNECSVWQLSLAIQRLAGEPTKHNKDIFFRTFVKSLVGVRVPNEFGTFPAGNFVVTSKGRIPIPMAIRAADKMPFLCVLADVDKLCRMEAATIFAEFEAQPVIKMALEIKTGIIVESGAPGRGALAIITANEVAILSDL